MSFLGGDVQCGILRATLILAVSALVWGCAARAALADPPSSSSLLPAGLSAARPLGTPALSRASALAAMGYTEEEFFLRGQARIYTPTGPWEKDGQWTATPASIGQPYTTRLLVRRPANPARFNGVVVMEWLNTALGNDIDAGWILTRDELIREGYAWVGVTTQVAGIEGLKRSSPTRYAAAQIDNDDLGFDIFSHAGVAVRQHAQELLGPAPAVKALLASGYSESAVFLNTYINAIQPREKLFDGFFLHGRAPIAKPLNSTQWSTFNPRIRADLSAPVLQIQTEMEVAVSWPLSKTVDTDKVRYWEVAGASHFGKYLQDELRPLPAAELNPAPASCFKPVNTLPLQQVDNAALNALRVWVTENKPPPKAERMRRNALGFVKHDEHGNALGGLRLPELTVPTASYGMYANFSKWSLLFKDVYSCVAGGSTQPFDSVDLRKLYPTHEAYVQQYRIAADAALAAGFLRPADHAIALTRAQLANIPE
ncbi:MAG: hypothetical protein KGL90_03190 [Burkholderiales bacterium]|nr:hypothetical protein [Burkholderiales bacterium]